MSLKRFQRSHSDVKDVEEPAFKRLRRAMTNEELQKLYERLLDAASQVFETIHAKEEETLTQDWDRMIKVDETVKAAQVQCEQAAVTMGGFFVVDPETGVVVPTTTKKYEVVPPHPDNKLNIRIKS
jgi:aromatic ring hydroxylase